MSRVRSHDDANRGKQKSEPGPATTHHWNESHADHATNEGEKTGTDQAIHARRGGSSWVLRITHGKAKVWARLATRTRVATRRNDTLAPLPSLSFCLFPYGFRNDAMRQGARILQ